VAPLPALAAPRNLPDQFWYPRRVKKALVLAFVCLTAILAMWPLRGQTPAPAPAPSARKVTTVVLDPAHGGTDTGARGSAGTIESDAVVDFGRAIRVALEAKGFHVILTREGNQSPSFDDRAAAANGLMDAVFVTLHVSSTGTPGTARAYFCSILPAPAPQAAARSTPQQNAPRRPAGLLEWDRAQATYTDSSRRLAELMQVQLAQHFQGSPETPSSAPIRQLRTVAAPAIAIEVSSVAMDAAKLSQMGQPLGEALARAAAAFQESLGGGAPEQKPEPGAGR
jgi:N-acetylmuramoyl-L-alanine amidase